MPPEVASPILRDTVVTSFVTQITKHPTLSIRKQWHLHKMVDCARGIITIIEYIPMVFGANAIEVELMPLFRMGDQYWSGLDEVFISAQQTHSMKLHWTSEFVFEDQCLEYRYMLSTDLGSFGLCTIVSTDCSFTRHHSGCAVI